MKNWQVAYYKRENVPVTIKYFANMNTASAFCEKLRKQGIGGEMSPVWQGGNDVPIELETWYDTADK